MQLFKIISLGLFSLGMALPAHADEPTKAIERAEAAKLVQITCEKLPLVLDGFSSLLDKAIGASPLEMSLRQKLQMAKDTTTSLKAICAQKLSTETATNPEMSDYFLKLKTPAAGAAAIANYIVLNFSTGTDADKPVADAAANVNALVEMLDEGAQFFASKYAH